AIRGIIEELRHYEATQGKKPLAFAPLKPGAHGRKRESNSERKPREPQTQAKSAKVGQERPASAAGDNLGICPSCGGGVVEREKGYGCQNWKDGCPFILWKNPICGKVLTPAQVKSLLKKGKTNLIKGFRSKNGKSFAAYLVWEDPSSGKLKFEFENNDRAKPG
ncbi:MAG: topoisomerase C-terminal repeat-containing protein, partial [Desulfitobacterium hafniense]